MNFDIPFDFCELPTDLKSAALKSAETALRRQDQVFFQGKQFKNYDELNSHLTNLCKSVGVDSDWHGEMTEDYNG